MTRTATVLSVVGARPNFMKVAPLYRALRGAPHFQQHLVHTGQHYDWDMSRSFFEDLELPDPDFNLEVGSGSHAEQTAGVMVRLEPVIEKLQPSLVVVVGDVNSTLAAAITAKKLQVDVAHVEAGLRSGDRSMPEELNRLVTDTLSDVLFAPSNDAVQNLLAEGVPPERIELVGNIMIDSLLSALHLADRSDVLDRIGLRERDYILVTLHRPSNVDELERLHAVAAILLAAARASAVVFVAHPRTRARLDATGLEEELAAAGAQVVPPEGYVDFLKLMAEARCVLTDSGGVQEETTVLGVRCLTMRTSTERPITISEGTNRLVGIEPDAVIQALEETLASPPPEPRRPPLWDGRTAERIVSALASRYA